MMSCAVFYNLDYRKTFHKTQPVATRQALDKYSAVISALLACRRSRTSQRVKIRASVLLTVVRISKGICTAPVRHQKGDDAVKHADKNINTQNAIRWPSGNAASVITAAATVVSNRLNHHTICISVL